MQAHPVHQRRYEFGAPRPVEGSDAALVLNAALALGVVAARLARSAGRPVTSVAGRALRIGAHLPPVGLRRAVTAELAAQGADMRVRLERATAELLRLLLRRGVEVALSTIDLTDLVRRHLDVNAVALDLDVDAVVGRADLVAVVDRIDLDTVVAGIDVGAIVSRVDVDEVVKTVDLDAVLSRVDLDAVVSRVDLDAVLSRLDVDAVLSRLDLDEVAARIDLDAIVARIEPDAVVSRVDVEAVIRRLDLVALTREVIEGIDLPAIVHQSSGAVSSQAARAVRAEGMNADESVSRFVDRVLRRPHPRGPVTP